MRHPLLPVALILSAATALPAQVGAGKIYDANLPGDGTLPAGSLYLTQTLIDSFGDDGTGLDDIRGVARLPNGHYIVVQGPEGGLIPKKYFELDSDGSFLSSVDQPFLTGATGDIGLTDLAWDHETDASSRIWAGRAKGISSFDWQNLTFDPTFSGSNPTVGLKVLTGFVGTDVRASAIAEVGGQKIYVSASNKGFRIGNPDDSDTNYHLMGIPAFDFPAWQTATNNINGPLGGPDQGKLGAAWDPHRGTIWWGLDTRTNNPNPNQSAMRFVEMDMDGNLTGQIVQGVREIGGIPNGCELYVDDFGNLVMVYVVSMSTADVSPIGLTADHDVMVEMYLGPQFGSSCGGDAAFDTEPYIGNADWAITLRNAPDNPTMSAIMVRGSADPAGFQIPGINNCPLLISLGTFNNRGAKALVNGAATHARPLPDDLGLVGTEATWQWLLPSGLNILPLDLSDALSVRIGTNL